MLLKFLLLSGVISSCVKTTMVHGKFTNYATGKPIEGIRVLLAANRSNNHGGIDNISVDQDTTDSNGDYSLEVEGKNIEYVLLRALNIPKDFVDPKYRSIKIGKSRTEDFALKPYDAQLNLTVRHESNTIPTRFYYYFSGPFFEDQTDPVNPEALKGEEIPVGSSKTFVHLVPGGDKIDITWDTKKFDFTYNKSPNVVSVDCPRNVTTEYTLTY